MAEAWPTDAAFARGDEVELIGLSKEHLNGARGLVTSYDCEKGRFSIQLSGSGALPLAVRPQNLTRAAPLGAAAEEDEEEAAEHERWLAALPTMTAENLGEELLEAARYGESREVGELLAAWANIDYTDPGGNTALHRACANGHTAVVLLLAREGARLLKNDSGNLALHWAVQRSDAKLVQALLDAYPDADVLAKNDFGKSVSTEAFGRNDPAIVNAVLEHASASKLDPEENPDTPDALTSEVTHVFHFGGVDENGDAAAAAGDGCGPAGRVLSALQCREINSIGGDDPTAVIGATANDDRTGLQIWSASLVLSRWVSDGLAPRLRGKAICELGAGCALPAIAAAVHAGASRVLATDLALPTMDNMRFNLELNGLGGRASAEVIDWGDRGTWPEPFEALLGSDLVYSNEAVPQLLALVPALLAPGGAFFYVAPETNRLGERDFLEGLVALGFSRRDEPVPQRYLANVLDGSNADDFGQIFPELAQRTYTLYTFRREEDTHATLAQCVPIVGFAMAAAAAVRQPAAPSGQRAAGGAAEGPVQLSVVATGASAVRLRLVAR